MFKRFQVFVSCIVLASFGMAESDPWEGYNRKIFAFNEVLDRFLLKPVAQGYQYVTPQVVDDSVTNFYDNLGEVRNVTNDLLQLKFKQAGIDTGRFVINSTVGVLGLFDVAAMMNLPPNVEDFGQTLGYWGVPSGPYIVWPILGPNNVRDTFGAIGDLPVDPLNYSYVAKDYWVRYPLKVLNVIDTRADLIQAESMLVGDRYQAMRDTYLEHREFLVKDGVVKDDFGVLDLSDDLDALDELDELESLEDW